MQKIEDANSNDHHGPVQRDEVPLMRDQKPAPALQELNGPVNAPDENGHHAQRRRPHQEPQVSLGASAAHSDEEDDAQDRENGDRGQLEEDAGDHDVGSGLRVPGRRARSVRGQGASDGLDDKRDDVAGAEDPEVRFG